MQTNDLRAQAKQIMTTYACRDLEGEEREHMIHAVERFFNEHVSKRDPSEIMAHMATPMKALEWFHSYVCDRFWRHCCAT